MTYGINFQIHFVGFFIVFTSCDGGQVMVSVVTFIKPPLTTNNFS
ncbi:hypothetical protein V6Z12_D09G146300 [Gossypium hirsutum]